MDRITATIKTFCEDIADIGVTKATELMNEGEIDTVVVGARRLVIVDSYYRYLDRQRAKPQDARRNKAGAIPAFGARRAERSSSDEVDQKCLTVKQAEADRKSRRRIRAVEEQRSLSARADTSK